MNPNKAEGATDFVEQRRFVEDDVFVREQDSAEIRINELKVMVEQLNKRVTKLQKELLAHTQVKGCRE